MESLLLREILASLLKEFETAGVAADVSREHWRQVYESNALLREFAPSRIRILEATVSLPLALTSIATPKAQPVHLTRMQLLRLLPVSLPLDERTRLADDATAYVNQERRISFSNKQFTETVVEFVAKRMSPAAAKNPALSRELEDFSGNLEKLRVDFLSKVNANPEREASFAYRTEELEKLDASRLVRFDLKLALD